MWLREAHEVRQRPHLRQNVFAVCALLASWLLTASAHGGSAEAAQEGNQIAMLLGGAAERRSDGRLDLDDPAVLLVEQQMQFPVTRLQHQAVRCPAAGEAAQYRPIAQRDVHRFIAGGDPRTGVIKGLIEFRQRQGTSDAGEIGPMGPAAALSGVTLGT